MKNFFFLFFILFLFKETEELCDGENEYLYEGYCYKGFYDFMMWSDAYDECRNWNEAAHFISLQESLVSVFDRYQDMDSISVWFGLNKIGRVDDEVWEYSDGKNVETKYILWNTQGDEDLQHCAVYEHKLQSKVSTYFCWLPNQFICRFPVCNPTCPPANSWDNIEFDIFTRQVSCDLVNDDCPSYYSKCFGKSITKGESSSEGCNHNGVCVDIDECSCFGNYSGTDCFCESPGIGIGDFCYEAFPHETLTWSDAEMFCRERFPEKGHLATISTLRINMELQSEFSESFNDESAWIGINDIQYNGDYFWTQGTEVDYTNWLIGSPDDSMSTRCGMFYTMPLLDSFWDDEDCSTELPFICSYEKCEDAENCVELDKWNFQYNVSNNLISCNISNGECPSTLSTCFGVKWDDNNSCTNHGECTSYNHCECEEDWGPKNIYDETAEICSLPICQGKLSNHPNICSLNGVCNSTTFLCDCYTDGDIILWRGEECSESICNNVSVGVQCTAYGECNDEHICECYDDKKRTGINCEVPMCFGYSQTNSLVCSGFGNCSNSGGECFCDDDHIGENCEWDKCHSDLDCGHGVCINETGFCNCTTPELFVGYDCTDHLCYGKLFTDDTVCNGRGNCTIDHTCECNDLWNGKECEYPRCGDYYSNDVDVNGTFLVCNGRGVCLDSHICSCESDWTGDFCFFPKCQGKFGNDACSKRGVCTESLECDCYSYATGDNCEYLVCFGKASNRGACNSRGECVLESDEGITSTKCVCRSDYTGDQCTVPVCFGKVAGSGEECTEKGVCIRGNRCECPEGKWAGNECQYPYCDGVLSTFEETCNGRGVCEEYNVCNCTNEYDGVFCEDFAEEEAVYLPLVFIISGSVFGGFCLLAVIIIVIAIVIEKFQKASNMNGIINE